MYARHVRGITMRGVRFELAAPDNRPPLIYDDAEEIELDGVQADAGSGGELARLMATRDVFIHGCRLRSAGASLLRVEGARSSGIRLVANDPGFTGQTASFGDGARPDAVKA
jgi:hypothetical protein